VSTARLLLRRWQALVLLMGALASANASVFSNMDTFARPLLLVVAPGHGAGWRGACIALLMAAGALWAQMQRGQIGGGGFVAFTASLPFTPRQRRRVDLAALALADTAAPSGSTASPWIRPRPPPGKGRRMPPTNARCIPS
jgi:hypothetical protein